MPQRREQKVCALCGVAVAWQGLASHLGSSVCRALANTQAARNLGLSRSPSRTVQIACQRAGLVRMLATRRTMRGGLIREPWAPRWATDLAAACYLAVRDGYNGLPQHLKALAAHYATELLCASVEDERTRYLAGKDPLAVLAMLGVLRENKRPRR
jgi:hypothetical protein